MHIGLMMECDYREGRTQDEAFDEAFSTAESAEEWGLDGVWLAERHFASPGRRRGIPSVVASPLIFATAIAARTSRLRIGTAMLVLPLVHGIEGGGTNPGGSGSRSFYFLDPDGNRLEIFTDAMKVPNGEQFPRAEYAEAVKAYVRR
jgi:catechol 2,3-dioxygenase-like lactoylglutathione lyase family enzyme